MYLGSERLSFLRIIFLATGYLYFHFVEMIDENFFHREPARHRESRARDVEIKHDLKCQNNNLWRMSTATHVPLYEVGFSRENSRVVESDIYQHVYSFWKSWILQRLSQIWKGYLRIREISWTFINEYLLFKTKAPSQFPIVGNR